MTESPPPSHHIQGVTQQHQQRLRPVGRHGTRPDPRTTLIPGSARAHTPSSCRTRPSDSTRCRFQCRDDRAWPCARRTTRNASALWPGQYPSDLLHERPGEAKGARGVTATAKTAQTSDAATPPAPCTTAAAPLYQQLPAQLGCPNSTTPPKPYCRPRRRHRRVAVPYRGSGTIISLDTRPAFAPIHSPHRRTQCCAKVCPCPPPRTPMSRC